MTNIPAFIDAVKSGKGEKRLMGFGHRVYKSYDPRAKIVKKLCDDVLEGRRGCRRTWRSRWSSSGSRSRTNTSSRASSIRTSTSTRG